MGWVVRGSAGNLDRLNERPIYLRFFFTVMAFIQSCIHLYYGQSYLHLSVTNSPTPQSNDQDTHSYEPVHIQLQKKAPVIGMHALLASGLATITAPFVYKAFFRNLFWKSHLAFAKPFFNLSRSDAQPPDTYFIGTILGWAFFVGAALSFSWELASHSFLIYLKQMPLKNGLPLSAGSKDPNGTLLNGLMAKRSVVKTFAFWELALIAQKHPDRRKAIFSDFERPNGPMWTSILKTALSVISSVDSRILSLNPSTPQPIQTQQPPQINGLPRIAKDPSHQHIVTSFPPPSTRTQKVQDFLAITGAKRLGQSNNPWSPPIRETQQKLIEYAKPVVDAGANELRTNINHAIDHGLINSLVGPQPAKRISGVILGNPVGNAAIIVDAIEIVTKMLVASLNEDDFGKVVQTVPESVKQFSRTVMMIEGYVSANSNILTAADEQELREVCIIIERLKIGLRELLAAFQVFLNDVGLGIKDLNDARRASEERQLLPKKPERKALEQQSEMEEVGERGTQRQSNSYEAIKESYEDHGVQRTRETAQSLRRIESQPRRQRISGGDGNVFGARELSTARSRDVGLVR